MDKYYISKSYGYGKYRVWCDSSSDWHYLIFPDTNFSIASDLPPIFIIEKEDCFIEVLTNRKIRKVTYDVTANPKKYLILKENETYIIDEFCFYDNPYKSGSQFSIDVTIFYKELKKCKMKFIKRSKIEKYFNDAPVFAKELKEKEETKEKIKISKENKARKQIEKVLNPISATNQTSANKVLLEAKKNELLSANTSRNSAASNNYENDPLGEYIANQAKQKRK